MCHKLNFQAGHTCEEQWAFSPLSYRLSHLHRGRPQCLPLGRMRAKAAKGCTFVLSFQKVSIILLFSLLKKAPPSKSSLKVFTKIWALMRNHNHQLMTSQSWGKMIKPYFNQHFNKTAILRYNSHTTPFTYLKSMIYWLLVYSELGLLLPPWILGHFHCRKKKPCAH